MELYFSNTEIQILKQNGMVNFKIFNKDIKERFLYKSLSLRAILLVVLYDSPSALNAWKSGQRGGGGGHVPDPHKNSCECYDTA